MNYSFLLSCVVFARVARKYTLRRKLARIGGENGAHLELEEYLEDLDEYLENAAWQHFDCPYLVENCYSALIQSNPKMGPDRLE